MGVLDDIMSCCAHRPYSLVDYSWFLYDEEISQNLDEKLLEEDYYVFRLELQILSDNADEIISRATIDQNRHLRIIELGAGTASKTSLLLKAAVKYQQSSLDYFPVDVSDTALATAKTNLERLIPDVRVQPKICNFMSDSLDFPKFDGCTLVLYLGVTVTNFTMEQSIDFLSRIRNQLQPKDALLISFDLKKDPAIIESAYNGPKAYSNKFVLNFLHRLNRDFDCNINIDQFDSRIKWNEQKSCIEGGVVSLCAQQIKSKYCEDKCIDLESGDVIQLIVSYKYTVEEIRDLLSRAGLELDFMWTDENKWCLIVLARNP